MKIAIFGSTGRVGSIFMQHALDEGYEVQALVRKGRDVTPHENLTIIRGDATNIEDVNQTIDGCDAVFSGLNTDGTTTLSQSIAHIIEVMENKKIERIVTIGTAGIVESRVEPGKLRYLSSESRQRVKFAAGEHEKVYRALAESELDWTIICPTALVSEPRVGVYRYEKDYLPLDGRRISIYDTADLAFEALREHLFTHKRVGIAY